MLKKLKLVLFLGLCIGFLLALSTWGFPQVPIAPVPPTPLPGYYTIFIQPANSPSGNTQARYVWYGPDLNYAQCIADTQGILNQTTGLGSTAWNWKAYVTCYAYP